MLTEAAWLLRQEPDGIKALGELVRCGAVRVLDSTPPPWHWIIAFLERYASAGAQMADAAVMYLAEREGIDTVFTLDRRDFSIYRTTDGRALRIVPGAVIPRVCSADPIRHLATSLR